MVRDECLNGDIADPGKTVLREVSPGHGQIFGDTAPVEATLDHLRFVADVAASGRRTGLSPLEAARQADLGRFAGWADAERIVGIRHRAYAEHEGAPPGAAIDKVEALSHMVAYDGGSPLTCLA